MRGPVSLRPTMLTRVISAALALTLLSTSAWSKPDDDEATRRAKELFKAAETHYQLGRFDAALDDYTRAYEAKPLPGFLFNIGQCHMELGNYERAIFFYERFLRTKPEGKALALANTRMEEAKKGLEKAEQERQAREAIEREQEEERKRLAALRPPQTSEAAVQMTAPPPLTEAPFYKTWWFWTIAGAVVVGTAALVATQVGGETRTVLPSGELGTIDAR